MIRFAREFRLIPVVLLATISLFALKVSGLVFDGGYTLAERLQGRNKTDMQITSAESVPDYPKIVVAGEQAAPPAPAYFRGSQPSTSEPAACMAPEPRIVITRARVCRASVPAAVGPCVLRMRLRRAASAAGCEKREEHGYDALRSHGVPPEGVVLMVRLRVGSSTASKRTRPEQDPNGNKPMPIWARMPTAALAANIRREEEVGDRVLRPRYFASLSPWASSASRPRDA